MRTGLTIISVFLLTSLVFQPSAQAAGSKPATEAPQAAPTQTPEEAGKTAYNIGLKHRDKAWGYEDKAKIASGDERDKLLGKARKQHEKSIPLFETAIEKIPNFHQAHSSLGYALRKTGDFEASLEAYNRALELVPSYGEAIEYRAEAYLGLGRLSEVKEAYMQLFNQERALANQLMEAMQTWVKEQRAAPDGKVSNEAVDAFAAWLEERGEIAAQTARLEGAVASSW